MSEKCSSFYIQGTDENTDKPVRVVVTVDYLSTENVYVGVDGRSIEIPVEVAKELTGFLYNELGLNFGPVA